MAEKLAPEKRHIFLHNGQKILEWDQTLEEVNIYINIPPDVHPKQFYCKIQSKHIELGIKGNPPFLNHDLTLPAKTDSSFWTIEDDIMHITLQKREKGQTWGSPILGQAQLDPYSSDLEQKRLMLERFQEENPGFDFSQAQFSGDCPDPRTFMGGIKEINKGMGPTSLKSHAHNFEIAFTKSINIQSYEIRGPFAVASSGVNVEDLNKALGSAKIDDESVRIDCFSDIVNEVTVHFQIIRLPRQIYAWIGCNSAKFGHLYAAAPSRPSNGVSLSCVLGGGSDNTGSGIARRIVLKTGLHVVLASNIPKNSPLIEAEAEKLLIQKLIQLGYTRPKPELSS